MNVDRALDEAANQDRALQRRAVFEEMARRFNTAVVTRTTATLEEAASRAAADKRRQFAFESRLDERRDRVAAVTAHLDYHAALRAQAIMDSNTLLEEDTEGRIEIFREEAFARSVLHQSAVVLQEAHLRGRMAFLHTTSLSVLSRLATCQRQRVIAMGEESARRAAITSAEAAGWAPLAQAFGPGMVVATHAEYVRVCEQHERGLLEAAEAARLDRVAVAEIIARPRAEVEGAAGVLRRALEDERVAFLLAARRGMLAGLADVCARIAGQTVPLFTDDELPIMMQRAAVMAAAARGRETVERSRLEGLAALWDAARAEAQECVVQQTLRDLNNIRRGIARGVPAGGARVARGPPRREATEADVIAIQRAWRRHRAMKDPRRGAHLAWSQFGAPGETTVPPHAAGPWGAGGVEVPEGFAADVPPPRSAFTRADPWHAVRRLFGMRRLPDEHRQAVCGIWVSTIRDYVDGGYYLKMEHTRGMTWEELCAAGRDPLRDVKRTVRRLGLYVGRVVVMCIPFLVIGALSVSTH